MKKKISLAMALVAVVSAFSAFTASAATPAVYHTGVKAFINNYAIESYTINDHTVVSTDDLKDYGFRVVWDENARAVYITKDAFKSVWAPHADVVNWEAYNGIAVYDTVPSDIKVYVDGEKVDSYVVDKSTFKYGTLPNPTFEDRFGTETYVNLADLVKASSFRYTVEKQWFADEKNSFLWIINHENVPAEPMNAKNQPAFAHLTYTRAFDIAKWAFNNSIYNGTGLLLVDDIRYNYNDNMYVVNVNGMEAYRFDLLFNGAPIGATLTVYANGGFSFDNIPSWIDFNILNK